MAGWFVTWRAFVSPLIEAVARWRNQHGSERRQGLRVRRRSAGRGERGDTPATALQGAMALGDRGVAGMDIRRAGYAPLHAGGCALRGAAIGGFEHDGFEG